MFVVNPTYATSFAPAATLSENPKSHGPRAANAIGLVAVSVASAHDGSTRAPTSPASPASPPSGPPPLPPQPTTSTHIPTSDRMLRAVQRSYPRNSAASFGHFSCACAKHDRRVLITWRHEASLGLGFG